MSVCLCVQVFSVPVAERRYKEMSVCMSVSVCPSVCLSVCVQVFSVPVEERRYKEMAEQQFGDRGREQAKTCADIMAKTGLSLV